MTIQNMSSLMTMQRMLGINRTDAAGSLNRLSSGLRINSAADDAAGMAVSARMRGQIGGLNRASENVQSAINLMQTADGAMDSTQSLLQRMRELAVQSSNATLNDSDRAHLNREFAALQSELDRISASTHFNNIPLMGGPATGLGAVQEMGISQVSYTGLIEDGARFTLTQQGENFNITANVGGSIAMTEVAPGDTQATFDFGGGQTVTLAFDDVGSLQEGVVSGIEFPAPPEEAGSAAMELANEFTEQPSGIEISAPPEEAESAAMAVANASAEQASSFINEGPMRVDPDATPVPPIEVATNPMDDVLSPPAPADLDYVAPPEFRDLEESASTAIAAPTPEVAAPPAEVLPEDTMLAFAPEEMAAPAGPDAALSAPAIAPVDLSSAPVDPATAAESVAVPANAAFAPAVFPIPETEPVNPATPPVDLAAAPPAGIPADAAAMPEAFTTPIQPEVTPVDPVAAAQAPATPVAATPDVAPQAAAVAPDAAEVPEAAPEAVAPPVNPAAALVAPQILGPVETETNLPPEVVVPQATAPEAAVPDQPAPEMAAPPIEPEAAVPDQPTPELVAAPAAQPQTAPEAAVPDQPAPEMIAPPVEPEIAIPAQPAPEAAAPPVEPEAAIPDQVAPEAIAANAAPAAQPVPAGTANLSGAVSINSTSDFTFQIGANGSADQQMNMSIGNMSSLGLGVNNLNINTPGGASDALRAIDSAMDTASSQRATVGAAQNRMESAGRSLGVFRQNLTASQSEIQDADMAQEIMNFTRQQMMTEATYAMMAQNANMARSNMMAMLIR
ncbi:MAG: hypothetical protein FWE32_04650 [Oscillospiraceae bacterium]|nr:hypothetical protein [Oscillospiraceae bacterium]